MTTMTTKLAGLTVMAALSGWCFAAETQPPPQSAASAAPGQNAGGAEERSAPVLRITSVEVIRSTHGGTLDIVRVRGLASTEGWEEAELVPLTRGVPADGILELVFMAKAPSEAMEATGFEVVEAIFPLEPNHPYKGINVRGALEALSLTQFPGFVDGKGAGEDCKKCVGKTFVPKGAQMPAGKSSSDVVKEDQLPPATHVIRAGEGVGKVDPDPNRLTIILNKDNKITAAVWD
jgi:hypothetical protein